MKKKFLMTTAAAVLSLGVITACGAADEEPVVDDPAIEDPALGEDVPMDEPPAVEEGAEQIEEGAEEPFEEGAQEVEEELDVDVDEGTTGDELAEEEQQ